MARMCEKGLDNIKAPRNLMLYRTIGLHCSLVSIGHLMMNYEYAVLLFQCEWVCVYSFTTVDDLVYGCNNTPADDWVCVYSITPIDELAH